MGESLEYELKIRQKAWNLYRDERKKLPKIQKTISKYKTKWIKQRDENDLFEKWISIKTPNYNYYLEKDSRKKEILPEINDNSNARRSYRITIQNILNQQKKNKYVDPSPSDL